MKNTQELILLGLLRHGPKHGYELRKHVAEISGYYAGYRSSSIYYPLNRMAKSGWVRRKKARRGLRLEKHVFSLTTVGRKRLGELLLENLRLPSWPFFNLDLGLYFFDLVKKGQGIDALQRRSEEMGRTMRALRGQSLKLRRGGAPRRKQLIVEHGMVLLRAEMDFVKELLKELK